MMRRHLEKRTSKFDAVISSLERATQLLADNEEAKSRHREDPEQEVEFRRKLEQGRQLEEMRMEKKKQFKKKRRKEERRYKSEAVKIGYF